jgi:hypothetical protein
LIELCVKCSVPVMLENPATSMLWLAPRLQKLCTLDSHVSFITDFCQHGAKWRKRTRISCWHTPSCPQLCKVCSGKKGWCSARNRQHIVLSGVDPVSKQLWTHIAQPYPKLFAAKVAEHLILSSELCKDSRLHQLFGTGSSC